MRLSSCPPWSQADTHKEDQTSLCVPTRPTQELMSRTLKHTLCYKSVAPIFMGGGGSPYPMVLIFKFFMLCGHLPVDCTVVHCSLIHTLIIHTLCALLCHTFKHFCSLLVIRSCHALSDVYCTSTPLMFMHFLIITCSPAPGCDLVTFVLVLQLL